MLVGGGQVTQRTVREGKLRESLSPVDMLAKAARLALADAGAGEKLIRDIDTVAVVRFTADTPVEQGRLPRRLYRNPPRALAKHLGIAPRRALYTATGGNTPQWLVNRTAEEIASGDCEVALLVGAEYLATWMAALKQGIDLGWANNADADTRDDPEEIAEAEALLAMLVRLSGSKGEKEKRHLDELLDEGLKGTFPASDPVSVGRFTSTEPPSQPIDRDVVDLSGTHKSKSRRAHARVRRYG